MPFRRVHSARKAPSVRIGFFGVRDIEGMEEFLSVCSTLIYVLFLRKTIMTSSMNCCMHRVEGEY